MKEKGFYLQMRKTTSKGRRRELRFITGAVFYPTKTPLAEPLNN